MEVFIMNKEILDFYLQTIYRIEFRRSKKEQLENGKSHDHISEE